MLTLDHVLVAVGDPAAAALRLERELSLWCVPGPVFYGGFGAIVAPLPSGQFVCCVYVDDEQYTPNQWVRFLAAAPDDYFQLIGWAVRTDDIEWVAARSGAPILPQAIIASQDRLLSWRAVADVGTPIGGLPYFIEWDNGHGARDAWVSELLAAAAVPPSAQRLGQVATGVGEEHVRRWLVDDAEGVVHDDTLPTISSVTMHYCDGSTRLLRSIVT